MQYALQLGKPVLAAMERIFTTLDPGGIRGAKCCVSINGAVILTPTVCSHSIVVISVNGFTTATPALFTSKSIGPLAGLGDQVRDGGRFCQVMNQQDHFRAMWLNGFACLRQSYRIAPVQEEHRIVCGELLSNCTTDSAARACDEITLHGIGRKR